ncbi:MAG: hypothetical protein U5Q03_17790 [Bacteroidota bacterium]|nr:hypothetical protein [Bacteroidota bacterium]
MIISDEMLSVIGEPDTSIRLGLRTEGPYYDADGNRTILGTA